MEGLPGISQVDVMDNNGDFVYFCLLVSLRAMNGEFHSLGDENV